MNVSVLVTVSVLEVDDVSPLLNATAGKCVKEV